MSPNSSYKVGCKSEIGEKKCRRIVDHKFTLKLYRDIVSALNGVDTAQDIEQGRRVVLLDPPKPDAVVLNEGRQTHNPTGSEQSASSSPRD